MHCHRSFEVMAQGGRFGALSSFLEKLGQDEVNPTIITDKGNKTKAYRPWLY